MNGYYRGDDIDAGIIKHSTWLINTGKTLRRTCARTTARRSCPPT